MKLFLCCKVIPWRIKFYLWSSTAFGWALLMVYLSSIVASRSFRMIALSSEIVLRYSELVLRSCKLTLPISTVHAITCNKLEWSWKWLHRVPKGFHPPTIVSMNLWTCSTLVKLLCRSPIFPLHKDQGSNWRGCLRVWPLYFWENVRNGIKGSNFGVFMIKGYLRFVCQIFFEKGLDWMIKAYRVRIQDVQT